jgi:hypothetical protein
MKGYFSAEYLRREVFKAIDAANAAFAASQKGGIESFGLQHGPPGN